MPDYQHSENGVELVSPLKNWSVKAGQRDFYSFIVGLGES
jgi:hypothetical protein